MRAKSYPKYRDSGVVWLGKIPEHWEPRRLMYSLCRNDGGAWGDEPDGINDTIVLRSTEQTVDGLWRLDDPAMRRLSTVEKQNTFLEQGDLIITKSSGSASHIGKTSIVNDQVALLKPSFSNFMQRLRCGKGTFSKFVWFCLNNPIAREQFGYLSNTTTGLANLTAGTIGDVWLAFPPEIEQRTIAAFLDRETVRIDQLIAKKERQIELLQEKRTALISHAVTKGLNPNAKMKDSGIEWLGEIPEHWEVVPLKFITANKAGAIKTGPFGSQLLSSEMIVGEIKVYNQRNVLDGDFISGENYITQDKYKQLQSFRVDQGDILLTTRGTIGRCAIVPNDAETGILHPCLLRIKPNHRTIVPEYLVLLIQDSDLVQTQLFLASNATTIDVIYSETMKMVRIPLPSLQEQHSIIEYLQRESKRIDNLRGKIGNSIERLKEYRTALISAAVTGKIDVREETA